MCTYTVKKIKTIKECESYNEFTLEKAEKCRNKATYIFHWSDEDWDNLMCTIHYNKQEKGEVFRIK